MDLRDVRPSPWSARRWSRCRSSIAILITCISLILILIWAFAYTSWSMMGRFGLVSLGHGGFIGMWRLCKALLWNHLGVSPWLKAFRWAMATAAVLAVIVGYPCFRFRITGHYFVLVTLALYGIVLQVNIGSNWQYCCFFFFVAAQLRMLSSGICSQTSFMSSDVTATFPKA